MCLEQETHNEYSVYENFLMELEHCLSVTGKGERSTSQHHNQVTPGKVHQAPTAQDDVWNPEPSLDSLEKR